MPDKQCAPQDQLSAAAHDLKPPATPKDGGLLVFAAIHGSGGGAYLGEALCTASSADRWRLVLCRDSHSGIYFDSIRGDEELGTAGGLWRELQSALHAALREVHPRLFIDEEPAGAAP